MAGLGLEPVLLIFVLLAVHSVAIPGGKQEIWGIRKPGVQVSPSIRL